MKLVGIVTSLLLVTQVTQASDHYRSKKSTDDGRYVQKTEHDKSTKWTKDSSDEHSDDEHSDDEHSDDEHADGGSSDGGSSDGGGTASGGYTLLAWNDLGMHCVDGSDYSVFSILPPYNNLHAQLISDGEHVRSGVTLTYEAIYGTDGQINTTSMYDDNNNPKTNFWGYVPSLFGVTLPADTGLTGNKMPADAPQPLTYNVAAQWWEAEGIPITPYNDNGSKNYYPMIKVSAYDASGALLASAKTVLPVSDEMDCRVCHGSTSGYSAAQPSAGWINDADADKDYKYNILRLHDEKFPASVSGNASALAAKGYDYATSGLEATAANGTPVLCAACHLTNALPDVGIGLKPLTQALHATHAEVNDPVTSLKLDDAANRDTCYRCHPGAATACLRGAMGDAKNSDGTAMMQCQSCHGGMSNVGAPTRVGWLEQPNCQSCHQNGQRYVSAIDPTTGKLRTAFDTRFATNPDTPVDGMSLYRFSEGHGDLQCEACHGATHAIYPSADLADNLQSIELQGHEGTVSECTVCHTRVPLTVTGGPHGLHTIGQAWVKGHEDAAEHDSAQCTACHGSDYRGTPLSAVPVARTFSTEHGSKSYSAGTPVGCYDCHNGPNPD